MEQNQTTGPKMEKWLGRPMAVEIRDGAATRTEQVIVRELAIADMPLMATAADDEVALAALYINKPKDFAESMTRESFEKVIDAGEELNADFFGRWVARRLKRSEVMLPGFKAKVSALADSALRGSSQGSQPKQG